MAHVIRVPTTNQPYIGALEWGGYVWSSDAPAGQPTNIRFALANDTSAWSPIEVQAVVNSLHSWSSVANVTFTNVTNLADADLIEHSAPNNLWPSNVGDPRPILGEQAPAAFAYQSTKQYDQGILLSEQNKSNGYFNYSGFGWDFTDPNGGLNIGGAGFRTLTHELGHALGLAHPHDTAGGSGLFPGVTNGDYNSTGDNGLNQSVWSIMSYNVTQDAASAHTVTHGGTNKWFDSTGAAVDNYGYSAGPMAFDIAAIQALYGANTTNNSGNNEYILPDTNGVGTYFSCIWDTGGYDDIRYIGNRDVTIDLTAAALDDSPTGGGVISSAAGIHGGYTIANGVVIEGAYGGSGYDTLIGNAADNVLDGNLNADLMRGGLGNDTYYVDNAGDQVIERAGEGHDYIHTTLLSYTLPDNVEDLFFTAIPRHTVVSYSGTGNALDNTLIGVNSNDTLVGLGGNDTLMGLGGNDALNGGFVDPNDSFGRDGDDLISGFAGDDLIIASYGHDTVHGDEGSDTLSFAWLNNNLTIDLSAGAATFQASGSKQGVMPDGTPFGGAWVTTSSVTFDGIENVIGGHGNDRLTGDGADNVIEGREGDDTIVGNGGTDTAVFDIASTTARVYRLAGDAADSLYVDSADGHDHLIGIDQLRFTDLVVDASAIPELATNREFFGTIAHDAQSAGARVFTLYDGLLGRAPDALGLEHWADQLEHGASVDQIEQLFLSSPEGQARAGALGNADFVEQLYGATLHRAGDADGLAHWAAALDAGATRTDVADGFVFSPEHLGSLQPLFDAGIYVPDAQAADVARLYYTMLGRAPDATGLQHWTAEAEHGGSLQTLAEAFLAAPENVAHYGSLGNADYVDALYVNALGRHAEDVGLRHWTQLLDTGTSRANLAVELTASQEAHNVHLNQIETGWTLA